MPLETWRRRALALLATGALAAPLAACDVNSGGGADKALTYWSMWNKPEPQAKVIQKAVDAFEQKTGIHVKIQWIGRKVLTNVGANLNGGNLPDLVDQDATQLAGTFAATDSWLGLKDLYAAKVTGESGTVGDAVPLRYSDPFQTKDGQPAVVPYELISSAIWYNAAQLPEVASSPPQKWDDWMSVLGKQKKSGRSPLMLDSDIQVYDGYWWTWSAVRHGGAGAFHKAAGDKSGAAWDSPEFMEAAKDVEALVKQKHFVDGYTGTKWPAGQNAWANGESKSDFLLMGGWAPSETAPFGKKNPKPFEYRSFPYPQVPKGKGNKASELSVIGFAIPKQAKQGENAKKFTEFFLNKDQLKGISAEALNLSSRSDVEVPAELKDLKAQVDAAGDDVFLTDDGVQAGYPNYTTSVYYPTVQKFLQGKMDAAGFIRSMKSQSIQYWKSHKD